jgi:nucleoside-diphosphate-sugar epimerase
MVRQILVTGATGALGPPLIAELLRGDCAERIGLLIRPGACGVAERFQALVRPLEVEGLAARRLFAVAGELCGGWDGGEGLARETEVIVHAAADTRFRAPRLPQEETNVQGTYRVLEWARHCPRLSHVVLASTTCVAGTRTGEVAEAFAPEPPGFVNHYERTKWQAEQLASAADVPVRVVRLSTAVGRERDGAVGRMGALHHALHWLYRGLVPMVPGAASARVDLITTDAAAVFLARAAKLPFRGTEVFQVAAGSRAATLGELVEFLAGVFRETHEGWRRSQIARPMIVDGDTFAAFRRSVERSRDLLLGRVMESVDAFLPALLYPKTYHTQHAEGFWGGPLPLPDWRQTVRRAVEFCLRTNWGPPPRADDHHDRQQTARPA